jgi:5-methylcytosine-specific restriction enzyme A
MADRTRNPFYHTSRWKKESRTFRQQHPICSRCEAEGIIYPTEVTDHIIPLGICTDPWDKSNWGHLCKRHNIQKGIEDKKKYFRK